MQQSILQDANTAAVVNFITLKLWSNALVCVHLSTMTGLGADSEKEATQQFPGIHENETKTSVLLCYLLTSIQGLASFMHLLQAKGAAVVVKSIYKSQPLQIMCRNGKLNMQAWQAELRNIYQQAGIKVSMQQASSVV